MSAFASIDGQGDLWRASPGITGGPSRSTDQEYGFEADRVGAPPPTGGLASRGAIFALAVWRAARRDLTQSGQAKPNIARC